MKGKTKLIYGLGINDSKDKVSERVMINGKAKFIWCCPYYYRWVSLFSRCYSEYQIKKYPNYAGCTVCEDWMYLSNFITWVDSQPNRDWINCHLDKDLLVEGNKLYSPETCVFITSGLNTFLTDSKKSRGDCLIGVTYHKRDKVFEAKCNNPFSVNKEEGRYLGRFSTELEAHKAWQAKKHEYALVYAAQQQDPRVVKVLLERYAPDKDWTNK